MLAAHVKAHGVPPHLHPALPERRVTRWHTGSHLLWPSQAQAIDVFFFFLIKKKNLSRTSLVVEWIRIHLSMQGTRVQSLVWEDPTC